MAAFGPWFGVDGERCSLIDFGRGLEEIDPMIEAIFAFFLGPPAMPTISVCARSPLAQEWLVSTLKKPCDQITKADLEGESHWNFTPSEGFTPQIGDFSDMPNLTQVMLRFEEGKPFVEGSLDGLDKLEELYLSNNALRFADLKILRGLKNLKKLILENNVLGELKRDMFLGNPKLEYIDLRSCGIAKIEDGSFSGLPNLQTLFLASNSIREIGTGTFFGLNNLSYLDLILNPIELVGPFAFSLRSLMDVNLVGNEIRSLDPSAFTGAIDLEGITLSGHHLRELPPGLLQGLPSLKEVSLGGPELESIPKGFFAGPVLRLCLNDSPLRELNAEAFAGAAQVKELDLSGHALVSLPADLTKHLKSLFRFSIGGDQLDEVPVGFFDGMDHLEDVILGRAPLRRTSLAAFTGVPTELPMTFGVETSDTQGWGLE